VKIHNSKISWTKACEPGHLVSGFLAFVLLVFVILVSASPADASATNIYIAQSSTGTANGADCADARAYTFFNSSANWGSGTAQIGPGTTIHLCGTFTLPGGTVCALAFQGSGSSGNPITLKFETGALATAPFWTTQGPSASGLVGGFICSNGFNFLTVDGGTNGTIQATANGAALGNNNSGSAIFMSGSSNSEVKNMTISNMYQAVANSASNNNNTYAISWFGGSNVTIDNNVIHDCRWCILYGYPGSATSSTVQIFNNTIYNTDHCISIGDGNSNAILNGTNLVYGNVCHDWALFDAPADADHHNGFHIWAVHAGSVISDLKIYNNYVYGDIGQTPTAYIYIDIENGDSVTSITTEIFNNVIVNTSATDAISANIGGDGELFCQGSSVCSIYNNTFVGAVASTGCCSNSAITSQTTTGNPPVLTLKNNIYSTMSQGLDTSGGGTISASDYNDYYNLGAAAVRTGAGQFTLSVWQATSGNPDLHSFTSNPNLTAAYTLNSGSPAIGAGVNLTSLGITALDFDKAGVARPSSGAWDVGGFQYQTTAGAPAPPTALTAIVQ
jgi:hypothetical protein